MGMTHTHDISINVYIYSYNSNLRLLYLGWMFLDNKDINIDKKKSQYY